MTTCMKAVASLAVLTGMAFTAGASLTVVSSDRYVQISGLITENGSPVDVGGNTIGGPATGGWSELVGVSLNFGGGSVNGAASQGSVIGSTGLNFGGVADISAGGYVTTIVDDQGNPTEIIGEGSGGASSYIRVRFTIGYTGLWRFEGTTSVLEGGASDIYFTDGMGNVQYSISGDSSTDQMLLVPAGTYEIWAHAYASATATGSAFAAGRGEFGGSFTPVPAPGAAAVVGTGLLAVGRRRR